MGCGASSELDESTGPGPNQTLKGHHATLMAKPMGIMETTATLKDAKYQMAYVDIIPKCFKVVVKNDISGQKASDFVQRLAEEPIGCRFEYFDEMFTRMNEFLASSGMKPFSITPMPVSHLSKETLMHTFQWKTERKIGFDGQKYCNIVRIVFNTADAENQTPGVQAAVAALRQDMEKFYHNPSEDTAPCHKIEIPETEWDEAKMTESRAFIEGKGNTDEFAQIIGYMWG